MLNKHELIQQAITMQFNNIDSKLLIQQVADWLAHKPVVVKQKTYIFPHGVEHFRSMLRQTVEILENDTK